MRRAEAGRSSRRRCAGDACTWFVLLPLVLSLFAPPSAAAKAPEWIDRIPVQQGLDAFPDDEIVQLLHAYEVSVNGSGERHVVLRRVYHYRSGDDLHLRTFSFRQSPSLELKGLRAWVRDSKGETQEFEELLRSQLFGGALYSDEIDLTLALPAIGAGSVVAVELEYIDRMHGVPTHVVEAHEGISLASGSYELAVDKGRSAEALRLVADEPEPIPLEPRSTEPGRFRWQWGPIRVIQIEDPPRLMAPRPRSAVAVRLNEVPGETGWMQTWPSISTWFDGLCRSSLEKPGTLPEIAKTLRSASSGDDDRFVEEVSRYVRTNCRYVQIYLKDGGWRPHPAGDVESNRFGDCKDMAMEAIALLRAGGVAAFPVLTTSSSEVVRPELPTPLVFDHCIVAVETPGSPGRFVFFDPTAKNVPFGRLPSGIEDAWALVVGSNADTALVRLPESRSEDNRELYLANISMDAELGAHGSVEEVLIGQPAFEMRFGLSGLTNEQRVRIWQRKLDRMAPGAAVSDLSFPDLDAVADTLHVRYAVRIPSLGRKVAGRAYIRPDFLTARSYAFFPEMERSEEIAFRYPFELTTRIDIQFPGNARLEGAVPPALVENEFGRYSRTFEAIPRGVRLVRSERVNAARFGTEAYPQARRWDAAADSADHARIEIELP